jgi:hypothetical protein
MNFTNFKNEYLLLFGYTFIFITISLHSRFYMLYHKTHLKDTCRMKASYKFLSPFCVL